MWVFLQIGIFLFPEYLVEIFPREYFSTLPHSLNISTSYPMVSLYHRVLARSSRSRPNMGIPVEVACLPSDARKLREVAGGQAGEGTPSSRCLLGPAGLLCPGDGGHPLDPPHSREEHLGYLPTAVPLPLFAEGVPLTRALTSRQLLLRVLAVSGFTAFGLGKQGALGGPCLPPRA